MASSKSFLFIDRQPKIEIYDAIRGSSNWDIQVPENLLEQLSKTEYKYWKFVLISLQNDLIEIIKENEKRTIQEEEKSEKKIKIIKKRNFLKNIRSSNAVSTGKNA